MNASVPLLKRPPTSRPNTTRRQRPRPRWAACSKARPGRTSSPGRACPSHRTGQTKGGINRDLRPLPQRQAVGHHLDPPAVRRRHVKVEVPQSDAGGPTGRQMRAAARSSGPTLCASTPTCAQAGTVVPAAVWGERQRQSQPPKQEDAELPTVDDEVLAARDGGDRAAGSFAALGQKAAPGCNIQVKEKHLERALVHSSSGTLLPSPPRGGGKPGIFSEVGGRRALQQRWLSWRLAPLRS